MIDPQEVKEALDNLGIDINTCNRCDEQVLLFKSLRINEKTGKPYWEQVNLDMTKHWDTCPARQQTFKQKSYE